MWQTWTLPHAEHESAACPLHGYRYGADDFFNADGSEGELVGATVADCIAACQPELGCVGFKYKPWDGNKCFLRSYISLGECADAEGQDTWVYIGSPSADWERHADKNCMEGCVRSVSEIASVLVSGSFPVRPFGAAGTAPKTS